MPPRPAPTADPAPVDALVGPGAAAAHGPRVLDDGRLGAGFRAWFRTMERAARRPPPSTRAPL